MSVAYLIAELAGARETRGGLELDNETRTDFTVRINPKIAALLVGMARHFQTRETELAARFLEYTVDEAFRLALEPQDRLAIAHLADQELTAPFWEKHAERWNQKPPTEPISDPDNA
ncbi:MAG: hypothetical protein U1F76_16970 [Candidatus Competibacteraceae bacterium]